MLAQIAITLTVELDIGTGEKIGVFSDADVKRTYVGVYYLSSS